jgi:hypothetical protein
MTVNQVVVVVGAIAWMVLMVALMSRTRKRRWRPGPHAAGAIYDMLNEDRRKAIEIIVEQRAEERDPEDRDGNLPDLQHPR